MIPNRFVFIFLGSMEFSLVSYLAVRSAAQVNQPDEVEFLYENLPTGPWWEQARPYVTKLTKVDPPRSVGTAALPDPAHQADVLRLQTLLADGGIYLDLDVLSVRPLTPFLEKHCVLGQEGEGGKIHGVDVVCNGLVMAEPGSVFCKEWLDGFDPATSRWEGFRARGHDEHWNELSGRYPRYLATLFPDDVTLAPHDAFHWPLWTDEHLAWLFRGTGDDFPQAYCHHLWQSLSQDPYLNELTPGYIRDVDTNFTVMARPFID